MTIFLPNSEEIFSFLEKIMHMAKPCLHIENASLAYNGIPIFTSLNLTIPAGKWISLLGPSGVGKSSLLRLIAGLMQANEEAQGNIYIDNHDMHAGCAINHQIAFMAQTDLLLPWLTVLSNATLGLKLCSHTQKDYAAKVKKATLLLEKVGLGKATSLYPAQLSGGMRQRVALVRTLMEDKPIVLMDEPFSALDAITRHHLQDLAADLLKNKTVLFITHDPTEALRLAHDIYIMQGCPAELKLVAKLPSVIPRHFRDPEVIKWQALLFHELTKAAGETP
jgi:putative hydroxymethylpyrimidine transport system ATP-binding protein